MVLREDSGLSEVANTRRSPLHEAHEAAGGRLVDFAGWRLPVQYSGVIDEHLAVRRRAGLFDVSHMGEARIRGAGALPFLQWVTCNDVARLVPGKAHYNGLMTPQGGFVDDLLIYMLDRDDYLLVLNAANTAKDLDWLSGQAGDFEVQVSDESDDWAQLSLQGPRAAAILQGLAGTGTVELAYYHFVRCEVAGIEGIVSRTGYTGEDGFELYLPPQGALEAWNRILDAGRGQGLLPVGLGARDTLRLEARMTLYGNDIDESTTPLEAGLGWIVKPKKGDFLGRERLVQQKQEGLQRKLVGFEMRGRAIARHGYRALIDGEEAGRVTSGSFAPFLEKSIGLVYLPTDRAGIGAEFDVEIRRRVEGARIVATPFYKRER